MEIITAVASMSALAQNTRMEVFRLLIIQGPDGLPAGEIATKLQVPHNTLSTHLTILVQAGLMQSRRSSRSIIYSINEGGVRELLTYLLQDCCKGRPELCFPQQEAFGKKPRKVARQQRDTNG